jgi:hypothetical protein
VVPAVNDQPDVFDLKPELPDIRDDERHGFGKSAINKNIAGRGCNEQFISAISR